MQLHSQRETPFVKRKISSHKRETPFDNNSSKPLGGKLPLPSRYNSGSILCGCCDGHMTFRIRIHPVSILIQVTIMQNSFSLHERMMVYDDTIMAVT